MCVYVCVCVCVCVCACVCACVHEEVIDVTCLIFNTASVMSQTLAVYPPSGGVTGRIKGAFSFSSFVDQYFCILFI